MNLPARRSNLSPMMRRFCRPGLIAIAIAAAPVVAHGQSADLVLCDRVAADPSDPDKPADVKGVAEVVASDIATAIKYCAVAAKSSRRAMYRLVKYVMSPAPHSPNWMNSAAHSCSKCRNFRQKEMMLLKR